MGSAQTVDEATIMMANAAEARIRRCRLKIWGITRRLLVLGFLNYEGESVNGAGVPVEGRDFTQRRKVSRKGAKRVIPFCGFVCPLRFCVKLISEGVFPDFVQEGFIADPEVFGSFTLISQVGLQGAANLFSFDETEGAMTGFGEGAGKIELVEGF